MDKNELKQYLTGINTDSSEKNFVLNFYSRIGFLENLYASANVKDEGYGNVNSPVVLVFEDKEQFNNISKKLMEILKRLQMGMWEFYVTFIDKSIGKNAGVAPYEMLNAEMSAIQPRAAYMFCDDKKYMEITNMIQIPMTYQIDVSDFEKEKGMKNVWNKMKFIINIKKKSRRTM